MRRGTGVPSGAATTRSGGAAARALVTASAGPAALRINDVKSARPPKIRTWAA
jgi:hypothetical protein